MYVTAVLPYILLTVIFIRGLTLEGSLYGVMTFLNPDFSKLLEISVSMKNNDIATNVSL